MSCRPPHVKPPAGLSPSPPVPTPETETEAAKRRAAQADPLGLDPTRFGDWERKGIAVDF